MFKYLYIEITSVVRNMTSSPDVEAKEVILHGYFESSSNPKNDNKASILFNGIDYALDEVPVAIYLKPRESRQKTLGISAAEPWISNDEVRDAIRIDGLKEGGFRHSQITIFLCPSEIDEITKVDFNNQRLRFMPECFEGGKDPRPIEESKIDHFFRYINKNTIQIISQKI
jgi:hypothetical protein